MKWYMTVGYPGGEFARKCATSDDLAAALFSEPAIKLYSDETLVSAAARKFGFEVIRECPPDLVEWLDFPGMWEIEPQFKAAHSRRKVPGGWALVDGAGESAALTFIPVQGAQNITVLEQA